MDWFNLGILGGVALLIPTAYAGHIGAPYVPSRLAAVRRTFNELHIGAGDVVVDLGAGDGGILREAARHGATVYGFELSPIMWVIARLRLLGKGSVKLRNFYTKSVPTATVIYSFLMPKNMPRVRQWLSRQSLLHGRYFISYAFPFKNIEPWRVIHTPKCCTMYVYQLKDLTKSVES